MSTKTLLSWRTSALRARRGGAEGDAGDGDGHDRELPVVLELPAPPIRCPAPPDSGAGEGEEDVVERGWCTDVVDGDARLVEGPHDRRGEPPALGTGARSRRPSWLTWTAPAT